MYSHPPKDWFQHRVMQIGGQPAASYVRSALDGSAASYVHTDPSTCPASSFCFETTGADVIPPFPGRFRSCPLLKSR